MNSSEDLRSKLISIIFVFATAIIVIGLSYITILAVNFLTRENYQAASSLASIELVIITGLYVMFSYYNVRESQKLREQTERLRSEEQTDRRHRLRIALLSELKSMEASIKYTMSPGNVASNTFLRKEVYENNTDKLGYLKDTEVRNIVECYGAIINAQEDIIHEKPLGATAIPPNIYTVVQSRDLHQKLKNAIEEIEKNMIADSENIEPEESPGTHHRDTEFEGSNSNDRLQEEEIGEDSTPSS